MPEDSIALLPAHEIARRVRAREVSPVERHNPALNAVVALYGSASRHGLVPR